MANIKVISKYLKAIADPTRLRIIEILNNSEKPLCVNAISHKLNITQSAVSQHLHILKQLDLVRGNRAGYHIHYEVDCERFTYYNGILQKITNK
jgi:ArsR family transcriptional regulator, arsenate/arsenite/antimonite-responsive transcriptional repressor